MCRIPEERMRQFWWKVRLFVWSFVCFFLMIRLIPVNPSRSIIAIVAVFVVYALMRWVLNYRAFWLASAIGLGMVFIQP